jgi:hypothetical protein
VRAEQPEAGSDGNLKYFQTSKLQITSPKRKYLTLNKAGAIYPIFLYAEFSGWVESSI